MLYKDSSSPSPVFLLGLAPISFFVVFETWGFIFIIVCVVPPLPVETCEKRSLVIGESNNAQGKIWPCLFFLSSFPDV